MNTTALRPFAVCAAVLFAALNLIACQATVPANTPVPTTSTPTPEPTITRAATPRPEGPIEDVGGVCPEIYKKESIKSADGRWSAFSCYYDNKVYIIDNSAKSTAHVLAYNNSADTKEDTVLDAILWAKDSSALYVTATHIVSAPTLACYNLYRPVALIKFVLASGNSQFILGIPPYNRPMAIELSPNAQFIAYSVFDPLQNTVNIMDISENVVLTQAISKDYSGVLEFIWSPDSTKVGISLGKCAANEMTTTLAILPLSGNQLLTPLFFTKSDLSFHLYGWTKDDSIILEHAGLNDIFDYFDLKHKIFTGKSDSGYTIIH